MHEILESNYLQQSLTLFTMWESKGWGYSFLMYYYFEKLTQKKCTESIHQIACKKKKHIFIFYSYMR